MNQLGIFTLTDRCKQPESRLFGYLFTSDSLLLGTNGYREHYKNKKELGIGRYPGRFSMIESTPEHTVIQSDGAGQEVIFYGEFDDFWVVSNSLLAATEAMRAQGVDVVPYMPAIHGFKVGSGSLSGGQLISLNTPVSGIKILPAGYALRINYDGVSSASTTERSVQNRPELGVIPQGITNDYETYQEFITQTTAKISARAKVMAALDSFATMSLSGGVDSRMCLALLSQQETSLKNLYCYSHPHVKDEFDIAKSLCALVDAPHSGERVSNPSDIMKLGGFGRYKLAMYGNAGVNANYSFRANLPCKLKTTFTGGSLIGTVSMQRNVNDRKADYRQQLGELGDEVAQEYAYSLNHIGLSADNPAMPMHHYAQLRARIHYGLSWYKGLGSNQVHPLMDASLLDAANYVPLEYIAANGVNRDIIKMSRSELLNVPFDSSKKIKVAHSLARVGPLPKITYKIYGNLTDLAYPAEEVENYNKLWQPETSFRTLFEAQLDPMVETALQFNFDTAFIAEAEAELKNRRVRRAGILLGLTSLFNK